MAIKPALIQQIINKGLELNKPHSKLDNNGMLKSSIELKINNLVESLNSQIESDPKLKMDFAKLQKKELEKVDIETSEQLTEEETPETVDVAEEAALQEEASVEPESVEVTVVPKRGRRPKNS